MVINVEALINDYRNSKTRVDGASYIGKPVDYTIMFITKKVNHLINNLDGHNGCIVFAESGVEADNQETSIKNIFVYSDNPQLEYAQFAQIIAEKRFQVEKNRKYLLTNKGYYIGENVQIGENAYIEPGCLIGHDVIIGRDARILYGAVVKNATIGDRVIINEYAVVGSYGFTMAQDNNGDKMRIPTLGKIVIGDDVEIGAHNNISCGSAGNTVIEDHTKIDALVHVAHDNHLGKNTEITAGGILGGFVDAGEGTFVGLNAAIRNRISIGAHTTVGMGASVIHPVDEDKTVAGNPARILHT